MRRIVTAISSAALALSLVASAVPANAAVAGYDSAYAGESAFLTLNPGASGSFTVFFLNTGTTTWTKGTSTQVDLAACLEDKTTCNAQDATETPFNSGWLSATRYASTTQTSVAPGQVGTFTYNVAVPSAQAAGTYRFNGALVKADTGDDIHNEGYYQDVTVPSTAANQSITITPATDTNQTGQTHQVTITYKDSAGVAVANKPIDIFVVNDASAFTSTGACSVDSSASPNATGTACTIDSGDSLTNSSGQVTFSFTGSAKETHRIVAWTGAIGAVFDNDDVTLKGSATKTWIGAVGAADATPETKKNNFATSHSVDVQLTESDGTAVALSGQTIRVTLYRDTVDNATEGAASGTNGCTGAVVSTNALTTDSAGKATFTYTGPADPSSASGSKLFDCVFVHYDADGDNVLDSGEKTDTVQKEWNDETAAATTLTLSPTNDGNPESTTHVVTATLKDQFGSGISGAVIRFTIARRGATGVSQTVTSGISLSNSARTTGSDGTATFGYTGPSTSVEDTIDACYDKNDDGDCDDSGDIALTSVTAVSKFFATAAATGTTKAGGSDIVYCDKTNDQVYVQDAAQTSLFRFSYDSGDQFTIGGTPKTMADFETDCGTADTIAIPTYDTSGVSKFDLTNG